jgi:hypothetical protein
MPDLSKAIAVNYSKEPVVLQQVGTDDDGLLLIEVKAYGKIEEEVRVLCEMAERGVAVILPARNKNSKYIKCETERWQFQGELYHIGVATSRYGTQYIHRFEDEYGDEITWKTSKPQPLGKYVVNCRITGLTYFHGIEQTTVSHCKFERIE